MAQAIVNPEELRRFAQVLKRFNGDLRESVTSLHAQLAGLGLQLALVVVGSAINTVRRPLISLGPADVIRLRIQQPVQRLLHTRPDNLIDMPSKLPFVDLQRSQHCQCIV